MEIILALLVIIILAILFVVLSRKNNELDSPTSANLITVPKYKRKPSVMNRSESAFFYELQKQLPQDYFIFPKMRVADVLDIPNGHDYYRMRNRALPRHIDFLICDKNFKPVVAVEVNGSSHYNTKQIEADKIKNEMFKDSGLHLETVGVGSSFVDSVSNITSYCKSILLVGLLLITPLFSFATSGACSGHGGVSCSAGPDRDGSVICVDGWKNSSVSYSSMVKCGGYSIPTTPAKEQPKVVPQPVKVIPPQPIKVVSPEPVKVVPPEPVKKVEQKIEIKTETQKSEPVMPVIQKVETKVTEVTPAPQKKVGFWARVFSFFRSE